MIRNRYRGEPSRWHLLFLGLLLGLAIGLFIGWWLWPVSWTNSWPTDLSQEAKADYLAAVADAYVADGSGQARSLAETRLSTMRENLSQDIIDAKVYFSNNGPNHNIRISNLDQLATGLGITDAIGNAAMTSNPSLLTPNQTGDADLATGDVTGDIAVQTDTTGVGTALDTTSDVNIEGEGESTLASWIPWLLTLLSGLLLLLGALYILYLLSNRRMREQGHPSQSTPDSPPQHQSGSESYNEEFAPPQPYSDDEYDFNDDYHFGEEEIDEGQWRLTSGQMDQTQFTSTDQASRGQLSGEQLPGEQLPVRQQGGSTQRHHASLPPPRGRGQAQPLSAAYEPTGYEPPAQREMGTTQHPQQEHFQRTAPAIATAVNMGANPAGNRSASAQQVPAQQQTIEPYPDEEFFDDPFDDADDMAFDNETFDWSDTDPNRTINLTPDNGTAGNGMAQPRERSTENSRRGPAEDNAQFQQMQPEPIRSQERSQVQSQEHAALTSADQGLESLPEEIKSERFSERQSQAPKHDSVTAPAAPPTIDKAFMKQTRESSLVDKYVAHYHIGDHDYTQLYEIETEDGDHLGEFGIDIDGIHGILNQNPEYVTVLDVWLYDVTSEDSQTQLLLSQHARENGAGDTSRSDRRPLPASPGLKFQLEGSNLLLDCEVSEAKFLENNGPSGIFQSVTVEISAYRKNG